MDNNQEMVDAFKGKALNYVVVIRQIVNKNVTEGGIDLTLSTQKSENHKRGIVVSIGHGCPIKNDEGVVLVKEGSEVIYDGYKGTKITFDGIEYETIFFADLVFVL